ncbi:IS3 family transposase [Enorma massiliensis]|uniref:IS3 family transposase n=1 Tax=Enorma massiliensis TaxID=1472761 RepID=UPI003A956B7F
MRHRGVPHRPRQRVRQRRDRPHARGFGVERSLSARGCPYDNAVDESTNKILKAGLVYRESFRDLRDLQAGLSDYVHWYNNLRIHSTLGYMSPVEFRKAGMPLSKPSK